MRKIAARMKKATTAGRKASAAPELVTEEEVLFDDGDRFEDEVLDEEVFAHLSENEQDEHGYEEDDDEGGIDEIEDDAIDDGDGGEGGGDEDNHDDEEDDDGSEGTQDGDKEEEDADDEELSELDVESRKRLRKALREIAEGAKEIDLPRASIRDIGAKVLAKAISLSSTLEALNLEGNQIHDVGAIALIDAIATSKSITRLKLAYNYIKDESAKELAQVLANNTTITVLNLYDNEFGFDGLEALTKAVSGNITLKSLDLRKNNINADGAKTIGDMLAANNALETLFLGENDIGGEGAKALGDGLAANSTLTTLGLARSKIGMEGAKALRDGLAASSTLTTLDLGDNNIGDEGVRALGEGLAVNGTLVTLDLVGNKIGIEGAKVLCEVLAASSTLATLDLGRNNIGEDGVQALGKGLAASSTLATLTLNDNNIGFEGVKALSEVLAASSSLAELNLSANKIDDMGAKCLGEVLAVSSTLTELDLGGNGIGDEGAKFLGKGLAASKSLSMLILRLNKIGVTGAKALSYGLSKNGTLTTLSLEDNSIKDAGVEALCASLAATSTLTTLNLDNTKFGLKGAEALCTLLTKNESITRLIISYNSRLDVVIYERLARLLDANFTLTSVVGMPYIPEPLSFSELWSKQVGKDEEGMPVLNPLSRSERVEAIGKYLLDASGSYWTPAAHQLASENAHIFAVFVSILAEHAPTAAPFTDYHLWLQSDRDEGDEDAVQIFHALLDCRPAGRTYALPERFCQEFINGKLPLEDGLLLMGTEDKIGRSVRSLALANKNSKEWAKTYGTYLNRYNIAEGPPIHESKTCAVHFATDIRTNTPVALKIMRKKEQYIREIEARKVNNGKSLLGCLELLDRETEADRRLLDKEKCLVMPRGSRSLFEAINTERFAGRDLDKVREISHQLALALHHLHESNRIHGDIKPRNAVRTSKSSANTFLDNTEGGQMVSKAWRESPTGEGLNRQEEWLLIDLDASVEFETEVSEKASTGYVAPEVARSIFDGAKKPKGDASQDIWGFGALLYQLLSGTKLFMVDESDDNLVHNGDKLELMNWLALDEERMDRIKLRPKSGESQSVNEEERVGTGEDGLRGSEDEIEAARDLVRLCLRGKPDERISLDDLLRHPFFDKILASESEPSSQIEENLGSRESGNRRRSSRRSSRKSSRKSTRMSGSDRSSSSKRKSLYDKVPGPVKGRILSLHRSIKGLKSRFEPIEQTLRLSRRDKEKYPKWYHEPALSNELTALPTYHFFLSHMQQQAAGIVKDLAAGLERSQMTAWVDMRAAEITLETMQRGVLASQCFVMVLTTDVLFRPFCLAELKFAVDHFSCMSVPLEKHIFFLAEEDGRFSPWRAIEDEPWTWDDSGNDDVKTLRAQARAEMDKAATLEDLANETDEEELARSYQSEASEVRRKAKEYRCRIARRNLEKDLSGHLFRTSVGGADEHEESEVKYADNYKEYFEAAQEALKVCRIIPYRRRHFEEEAMIRKLATLAGFHTREPEEPRRVPSMCVIGKEDSSVVAELKRQLGSVSSIGEARVIIVVLEPGCCSAVHAALGIQPASGDEGADSSEDYAENESSGTIADGGNQLPEGKQFLAVENGWNFRGKEKERFHEDLQRKIFDHLEVLSWREQEEDSPAKSKRHSSLATKKRTYKTVSVNSKTSPPRNYTKEHELESLIVELQLRAHSLVASIDE